MADYKYHINLSGNSELSATHSINENSTTDAISTVGLITQTVDLRGDRVFMDGYGNDRRSGGVSVNKRGVWKLKLRTRRYHPIDDMTIINNIFTICNSKYLYISYSNLPNDVLEGGNFMAVCLDSIEYSNLAEKNENGIYCDTFVITLRKYRNAV